MMGNAVGTRTAAQCHSHHQKMMIKHGSMEEIIQKETALLASRGKIRLDHEECTLSQEKPQQVAEGISQTEKDIPKSSDDIWDHYISDLMTHRVSMIDFPDLDLA